MYQASFQTFRLVIYDGFAPNPSNPTTNQALTFFTHNVMSVSPTQFNSLAGHSILPGGRGLTINNKHVNYDDRCKWCTSKLDIKNVVKMTLKLAARPRRALARHSAGTYISSDRLQSHLCFTSATLVIHLFLSHSQVFHLWVYWSAKCPVNAS